MRRPKNILFILADQWRADSLSAVGHPVVRTPTLDTLAQEGVLFAQHYAQASPCGPSRASILTGMYLQNHRSARNGTPLDARFTNLARELRKAGYDPGLIGYTDTSADPRGRDPEDPALRTYEGVMPGFTPVLLLPEDPVAWLAYLRRLGYDVSARGREGASRPAAGYPDADARGPTYAPALYKAEHSDTAFTTDAALDYIAAHHDEPWCLHLVYLRPHPPFIAPEPYNKMYHPDAAPGFRRAATADEEAAQHPYLAWHLSRERKAAMMPDAHLRQLRATYYGLISEVDDQIGRVIAYLKETGQYEDTLIVFSCDHAEMLGDHWYLGKEGYFDQAFHIPLIVRAPGGTRGRVVNSFTEAVDLMPTILDLAGRAIPVQCDGASLAPWLRGETPRRWREEVHWEFDFRDVVGGAPERALGLRLDECCLNVIRDNRYKYVHFAALPPLLFDLENDPDELRNLAGDPRYAKTMLHYAQKMLSWRMVNDERTLSGFHLGASGPTERPRQER
ncbi:MAG TPA: alkaline phosphatase family protein [Alphaproteobacteria bacterium]|nr:alkaline phosphatase family protein [Alphaproteobacteria bacterium]